MRLNILIFTFDRLAVQVAAMTEKKIAIKLTAENDSGTEAADPKRCIICQKSTPEPTTGTENGRRRVHEAASIREDVVSKRLKVIGQEDFVYHSGKKGSVKKQLDSQKPSTGKTSEHLLLFTKHLRLQRKAQSNPADGKMPR